MSTSSTTSIGVFDASISAARMAADASFPVMDVVDLWVNLVTEQSSAAFLGAEENAHIPGYLGSNEGPLGVDKLLALMDELGVATGVFTGGLDRNTDGLLEVCDAHPDRFLVAGGVADPARPGRNVRRIRELAQHARF